jgi:hypothetical protein
MAWKVWLCGLLMVPLWTVCVQADDEIYDYEYESAFTGVNSHPAYKKHALDLGLEGYFYEYQEPSVSVTDEGEFGGVYAEYTFRRNADQTIKTFGDVIESNDLFNILKAEFRYARGQVDYTGTGTYDGITDYTYELRGLVGQEIYSKEDLRFMPFVGLAVRYLNDGFDEVPPSTVNGIDYDSGYERESRYIYIPIGVTIEKIKPDWSIALNLEVDFLIDGEQTSHLEDVYDSSGVSLGYDPLENEQEEGLGFRTSIEIVKYGENVHWVIEPFFRWWDIDTSNDATITQNGVPAVFEDPKSGDLYNLVGFEPANETWEAGVKIGMRF